LLRENSTIETGKTKDKLDDLVLSNEEKAENWILSCNAVPISDLILDTEDLTGIQIFQKKNNSSENKFN
jgi:CDP-4-dehydro-6-deoxyglucose reductase